MHHALEIQEILSEIFGHCHPLHLRLVRKNGSSDLASLARTCRTFKEPALNVLWEELPDLSPLVRCIPEASHRLTSHQAYSLSRPLTQAEWDVLRGYACRIRSIWDCEGGLDEKSITILSNLPTTKPLFPNLHFLSSKFRAEGMHLLRFHLPSLFSLVALCENSNLHWFQDYLESLPEFSRNIRHLSLRVDHFDVTFSKLVSKCICRWQNLETVSCTQVGLDVDALAHLSHMPALTELRCLVDTVVPTLDLPFLFSNLHDLTLCSGSMERISRLLSQSRLPAITHIATVVDSRPFKQDLSSFFAGIQTSNVGHTIKNFTLDQSASSFDIHEREPLLELEALRLCMAFSNLRDMVLNIQWKVCLNDSDLLTLTSAWPHLELLFINTHYGWNTSGGITPNGLLQLLQQCQSLCYTALAIDTRGYTKFPPSPENPALMSSRMFSIDVLDSAIEAESVPAVAAFFAGILHYSSDLSHAQDNWMLMRGPNSGVYKDRWCDVCKRVKDAIERRRCQTAVE